jgi:hypothetical protein
VTGELLQLDRQHFTSASGPRFSIFVIFVVSLSSMMAAPQQVALT